MWYVSFCDVCVAHFVLHHANLLALKSGKCHWIIRDQVREFLFNLARAEVWTTRGRPPSSRSSTEKTSAPSPQHWASTSRRWSTKGNAHAHTAKSWLDAQSDTWHTHSTTLHTLQHVTHTPPQDTHSTTVHTLQHTTHTPPHYTHFNTRHTLLHTTHNPTHDSK